MKSIGTRRAMGLILMSSGVLLAAFYVSGQINRSGAPAPQPNYGPLVPTPIDNAPLTVPANRSTTTSVATSAATPGRTQTSTSAPPSDASIDRTLTPAVDPGRIRASGASASKAPARPTRTFSTLASAMTPSPSLPAASNAQGSYSLRQRVCVGVPPERDAGPLRELRPGWYLNWSQSPAPAHPGGAEYAQMVRVPRGKIEPDLGTIAQIAQKDPGALWLIGNEMDVIWQDNATPEQYATAYHEVYVTLKQADPSSRVAIGGVSEPSPLRLRYLDRMLRVYRERYGQDMPIDVWNVHNFILPEERGSWGVDIPPGVDVTRGLTYTLEDHDNLIYFKQQLIDFRRWMAQRGYRDKELLVSEYGILMYEDYGFDYSRVRDFMLGSFDIMLNTTDANLGLPADGNRLVQRWCWYSLADVLYPTGNLTSVNDGALTPLGRDFKAYLDGH